MNYQDYLADVFNAETGEFNEELATEKAKAERGKTNILLMGATGVGKSSLINALFGKKIVESGQGKPITQRLEKIFIPTKGLTIWDTKGIEAADYQATKEQLYNEIKHAFDGLDENEIPAVAILCIKESSHRIEDRELELLDIVKEFGMSTVVVFTDTFNRADNNSFVEEAKRILNSKYQDIIDNRYVRVNSIEYPMLLDEQEIIVKPKGLDDLIETIIEALPKAKEQTKENFLKIQIVNQEKRLTAIIEGAKDIVNIASLAAGTVGALPIPGSDAPIIAAIQSTMIYKLNVEFEIDSETTDLTTLVTGILGTTLIAQVGRTAASALLKFIPLAGSVAGAATAASITKAIGHAYIAMLEHFYDKALGKVVLPDAMDTTLSIFKEHFVSISVNK